MIVVNKDLETNTHGCKGLSKVVVQGKIQTNLRVGSIMYRFLREEWPGMIRIHSFLIKFYDHSAIFFMDFTKS